MSIAAKKRKKRTEVPVYGHPTLAQAQSDLEDFLA